ncbi:PIN domain nuclease [Georgenia sp. 10Sc9-8]|uniref:Ribonuclease VapC n=1 Tax=Georgenia halotolerans TaxID=3028317 RepID=A0ABT5U201_9MICO|nr:PIN domain nuclease [Georgenia halotolerans]
MTLGDTSVWIEFLRGTPTAATAYVRDNVGKGLATSEPIVMELLSGARPGERTAQMERLLLSQTWYRIEPALDYRAAVDVFHAARAIGHQPRSLQDCLISAVALRRGVAVAHRDGDYEHIAAATGLHVVDLR